MTLSAPFERRTWRLAIEIVPVLAVVVACVLVFAHSSAVVPFHGDEGFYIRRARFFRYLFVEHSVSKPEWADNYDTHTQPMLANYIVGGALWASGYQNVRLAVYEFGAPLGRNRRSGAVPDRNLLMASRKPMVLFAAATVLALYVLARVLAGKVAGLCAAVLLLTSPLTREALVRAVSDPPLVFFIVLTLTVAVLGVMRGREGRLPLGWGIALGIVLGLGFGTKLTAVLSLAAIAVWAVLVAAIVTLRPGEPDGFRHRIARSWVAGRGWALALALAVVTFVLSDPHLYPNPVVHTVHLFDERAYRQARSEELFPKHALPTLSERAAYTLMGSLIDGFQRAEEYGQWAGARRFPLEAGLAIIGAAALVAGVWRDWRQRGALSAAGLVVLTTLLYLAGTIANLGFAQPRYLMPTVVLGALFAGLGASLIMTRLWSLAARFRVQLSFPERPRPELYRTLGRGS